VESIIGKAVGAEEGEPRSLAADVEEDLDQFEDLVEYDDELEPAAAADSATVAKAGYEPFLEDWVPTHLPTTTGTLMLNNRQLAIVGFLAASSLALMMMLAYAAGRAATDGPSRVVLVESAQATPAPQGPLNRAKAALPAAASAAAIEKASPVAQRETPVRLSYWQVGALDRGMAEVSRKYLAENGLPVRLEPVEGSNAVRVLVGPMLEGDGANIKKQLDGLGFEAFLKRY
jgi:hypothetical protein